jgi:iron complex outermembrane receptor protein
MAVTRSGRRARLAGFAAVLWCASSAICFADDALLRKLTSIPAGPLGQALQVLARDRDLEVAYVPDEVDPITTLGASGELTVDEALTQLLRNTGLIYRHSGANGISILPAAPGKTPAPAPGQGPRGPPKDDSGGGAQSGAPRRGGTPSGNSNSTPVQDSGLQEVRITAQRRSERLQSVPVAVTALPGNELEGKAVTQLNDLQYAVPSLSIGNAGLSNVVNIRGVGLASGSPAVANGVAVYVDGLFQTPTIYANQFYDIEDVEVLRGPQGTLVGTNSTGGAIFINSRNPHLGAVEGYLQAGGGSYDAWNTQGAINLPLSDVFALRVAAELTQHESFYHSVGPAYTDAGSLYEKGVRLGFLLEPRNFQALGKIEYVDRDTGGYAATPVPGSRYAPFAPADPFVLDYDTPRNSNHERELTLNLQLRYRFANGIALRSQSGYIDKPVHNLEDYDGTAVNTPSAPSLTYDQHVRGQHWIQEINLLSPQRGRSDWVAGVYLARSNINVNIYETGALGLQGPTQYLYIPQKKTITGWFGQLNFKLAPSWELQTGVRYSTYRVTGNGFNSLLLPSTSCAELSLLPAPWNGCKVGSSAGEESDARVTGKAAINYTLSEENLLYAFVARGYKPGGFNSPAVSFGPETVWDYELGWKSSPVQDHIRTQLGGFFYQYQNFQFQELQLSTGTVGVTNLPAATIDGLEGSLQARVAGWGIDAGVAYVHSKLPSRQPFVNNHLLPPSASNLPQCAPGGVSSASCFDYSPYLTSAASGPSLYAPQWSYNLGVQYEFHLGGDTSLTPRVNYAYVGEQFTSLTYSRVTDFLPAHGLLAAFLNWRVGRNWNIEAFGTNLTNAVYRTGEGLNSGNYYFYGAPRQYGVRARYDLR